MHMPGSRGEEQDIRKLYYSNFDKHHYKDFHRAQSTEPTTLTLNNFQCFSSNSLKFSVAIENAVDYSFLCKSLTRQPHGLENAEYRKVHNFQLLIIVKILPLQLIES